MQSGKIFIGLGFCCAKFKIILIISFGFHVKEIDVVETLIISKILNNNLLFSSKLVILLLNNLMKPFLLLWNS